MLETCSARSSACHKGASAEIAWTLVCSAATNMQHLKAPAWLAVIKGAAGAGRRSPACQPRQRSAACRYDSRGEEGADKCSWKYGETWEADNGATANLKLNGKSYLIQMNWAVGQGCSMGW